MATVDVASARAAHAALRPLAGLSVLVWPALDGLPVEAFVTARGGGVSAGPYESLNMSLAVGDDPDAVLENRWRVAGALGVDPADFVFCRQVHGAGVRVVTAADRGAGAFAVDESVPEADVLVTAEPGVVLAILAADCVPVVLYDPVAHVLACVHAGWRGTVARACAAAVSAMSALGARPADIVAGIGPAIGADRYQVGPEVAAAAEAGFGTGAAAGVGAAAAEAGVGTGGAGTTEAGFGTGAAAGVGAAAAEHRVRNGGTGTAETGFGTAAVPEVGPGGAGTSEGEFGGDEAVIRPDGTGRWLFDLAAANRLVLREAGVADGNVHVAPYVTGAGMFFSDREARPCGRLALVARLRPLGER